MSNTSNNGKVCIIRNVINTDVFVLSLTPKRDLLKRFTQIKNLINNYKKETDEYSKLHSSFLHLGSDWDKWYIDIIEVVEPCYTLRERLYYYSIRVGTLNKNYIGLVPDTRLLKDNISVVSSTPSRYNSVPNSPRNRIPINTTLQALEIHSVIQNQENS